LEVRVLKQSFDNLSWREILPKSFPWLETMQIKSISACLAGAHHVVPVTADKTDPSGFRIPTDLLSSNLKQEIVAAAKLHAWHGTGAPLTIDVNHSLFTLVVTSSIRTSKSQLGRQIGLDYASHIKGRPISHVVLCADGEIDALDVFEGLAQGLFVCHAFKGIIDGEDTGDGLPEKISVLGAALDPRKLAHAMAMAKAVSFTRSLQDAPPNILDSVHFGKIAQEMSADFGLKCSLKGRKEIREMGMGAFDSVAAGTLVDPRLITIEIKGKDTSRTVALVGKGLTFDAGGISIKPAGGMHEMKYDMSGGAAVLGTAMYLSMVTPPVNIVCIVGAVENMLGISATRPGDIVKAMNGKTIEIQNTDAEGRLVLADALFYAARDFKPELLVDIATLTGAVLFGLGTIGSALMTNDQASGEYALTAAKEAGEPFWQLPLWPELNREITSDVADFKNIASASVKAGTLVAGVFLREFVMDCKWVHLDIAGTGWNCKATGYPPNGGSAFGLRTLAKICMDINR
jgi:leucyl aminopeptidase